MNDGLPAISVIVPCRNEKEQIEVCVRSILAQEPPPGGFEIIVADGLSDDGTPAQFRSRWMRGQIRQSEVNAELRAQYERFYTIAGVPDLRMINGGRRSQRG